MRKWSPSSGGGTVPTGQSQLDLANLTQWISVTLSYFQHHVLPVRLYKPSELKRKSLLFFSQPPSMPTRAQGLGLLEKLSVPPVLEKNFRSIYLLCVSFITPTKHFTSDTSDHQMCMSFPHTTQSCETPAGVLHFNIVLYLPEDSIRSCRWRAQSPIVLQLWMPITGSMSSGYQQLLSNLATSWRFPWLLSLWIHLC